MERYAALAWGCMLTAKAMAGRAGTEVAVRVQDKHLHYSRGVTVEEMRQASMALIPEFG